MRQAKMNDIPINEPIAIQDIFATELAALESLGPCYRLTFTVTQAGYDDTTERVAVSKMVISVEALQEMLMDLPVMMRSLAEKPNRANRTQLN